MVTTSDDGRVREFIEKLPAKYAGVVDEIGSNVSEFNIGDNVAYAAVPIGAYSQQRIIPKKIAIISSNLIDYISFIKEPSR